MRTAPAALLGALLAVIALTTAPTASAHATRIAADPQRFSHLRFVDAGAPFRAADQNSPLIPARPGSSACSTITKQR
jgi:hypothetical protein